MQLATIENQITMTSLELVQFINNQRDVGAPELAHSDFLKKVPLVLGEVAGNFSSYYVASNGKQNPCYKFPKREACLMAMSYSYDLQAKVFDRMTELEQQNTFKLPNFLDPAESAIAWAEQFKAKQLALEQIEQQRPAVEFVEKYTKAENGSMTFRQVCKHLKANEARFREFLFDNEIMYRLAGNLMAYQNHIDAGRFEVTTDTFNNVITTKCHFTGKGVVWISEKWDKAKSQ